MLLGLIQRPKSLLLEILVFKFIAKYYEAESYFEKEEVVIRFEPVSKDLQFSA